MMVGLPRPLYCDSDRNNGVRIVRDAASARAFERMYVTAVKLTDLLRCKRQPRA
jgi:hypothetical protein